MRPSPSARSEFSATDLALPISIRHSCPSPETRLVREDRCARQRAIGSKSFSRHTPFTCARIGRVLLTDHQREPSAARSRPTRASVVGAGPFLDEDGRQPRSSLPGAAKLSPSRARTSRRCVSASRELARSTAGHRGARHSSSAARESSSWQLPLDLHSGRTDPSTLRRFLQRADAPIKGREPSWNSPLPFPHLRAGYPAVTLRAELEFTLVQ